MLKYKVYGGTINDGKFPEILYKYRDWNKKYHDRYIKEREVFMAPASSFPDKLDCKIPIRYDLLTEKQTIDFAVRLYKIEHPELSRQQQRETAREWTKKKLFKNKKYLEDFQKRYFEKFDKRRGILCVTEFPCLEKMWNDYANKATGFCIGYNSRILFEYLGGGGNVIYDTLPIILPQPIMENYEIHHKQLFYKELKWSYENEYRTHKFYDKSATLEMRQEKLPKSAFNKVILGKYISESNRTEIIKAVKENIGDIPIKEYKNIC